LLACQQAIGTAGLNINLELPPPLAIAQLAKAIPQEVKERLAAINHDAIEYDQDPERRGYVRSLCRLSGNHVSQSANSLWMIRGCRHCRNDISREEERSLNGRRAAQALWDAHRRGRRHSQVKMTDDIVAHIRTHHFQDYAHTREDVQIRFGITVTQSGLQYARSGRTHQHLNEKYPPVRKSA
jgi:hypothetical protein